MISLQVLSTLIKEFIKNSTSLLEEAELLANNNKIERAMFLTVIAIEEMGKISMYMNSIQYSKDIKEFWKMFNKYKTRHSFKIFRSLTFKKHMDLNFDFDFESSKDLSEEINSIKMSYMYVDIKGNKIMTPFESVNLKEYSIFNDFSVKLLANHQLLLEKKFYEKEFLQHIKNFYSDEKIQNLLHGLFKGEISSEDYIEKLIGIAVNKEDDIFAQGLLYSIYANIVEEGIR